jgi:hypothetical protein
MILNSKSNSEWQVAFHLVIKRAHLRAETLLDHKSDDLRQRVDFFQVLTGTYDHQLLLCPGDGYVEAFDIS